MRRATVLLVLLVTAVASQTPARAGGWWTGIQLEGRYAGVGETMNLRSEVWFPTLADAEAARTVDHHAYLVRGIDRELLRRGMSRAEPKRWWAPPREMILVGDVRLSRWDGNIAFATGAITIPDLTPGRYRLMLCDLGCATPLGNVVPQPLHVSGDAALARAVRTLERRNERLGQAVRRTRASVRRTSNENAEATASVAAALTRVEGEAQPGRDPSVPWIAYAGWFLAGATSVLLLLGRRRRTAVVLPDPPIERIPDDPRELTEAR